MGVEGREEREHWWWSSAAIAAAAAGHSSTVASSAAAAGTWQGSVIIVLLIIELFLKGSDREVTHMPKAVHIWGLRWLTPVPHGNRSPSQRVVRGE